MHGINKMYLYYVMFYILYIYCFNILCIFHYVIFCIISYLLYLPYLPIIFCIILYIIYISVSSFPCLCWFVSSEHVSNITLQVSNTIFHNTVKALNYFIKIVQPQHNTKCALLCGVLFVFVSFCSLWSSVLHRQSLIRLKLVLSSSCRSHWQKDSPVTGTVLGKATTSETMWELAM